MSERQKNLVISTLKEYASPALIGIAGMLMWRDINEMRSDVKLLLSDKANVQARVINLEEQMKILQSFHMSRTSTSPTTVAYGTEPKSFVRLETAETITGY
jgi:hypothetical protein